MEDCNNPFVLVRWPTSPRGRERCAALDAVGRREVSARGHGGNARGQEAPLGVADRPLFAEGPQRSGREDNLDEPAPATVSRAHRGSPKVQCRG